jgi:hypothetical protein
MLAEEHEVDLISFSSEKVNEERIMAMKPFCQKIQTTEYFSNDRNPIHSLRGFLSTKTKIGSSFLQPRDAATDPEG